MHKAATHWILSNYLVSKLNSLEALEGDGNFSLHHAFAHSCGWIVAYVDFLKYTLWSQKTQLSFQGNSILINAGMADFLI